LAKGGVYTLVVKRLVGAIAEKGKLMNNKVKWIKLKGLLQGDLSVMNVHMPNSSKEHNFLWVELIQKFPKDYRWIL
jgi:hypothetical protein